MKIRLNLDFLGMYRKIINGLGFWNWDLFFTLTPQAKAEDLSVLKPHTSYIIPQFNTPFKF